MVWDRALEIIILIAGFAALIKGADIFVDACVSIAIRARIPRIIIGLTIAAIGTSAPEGAVSVSAVLGGSGDLAVGNIVGSNIFNILIVLGFCALTKPLLIDIKDYLKDFLVYVAAAVALFVFIVVFENAIPRWASFAMLVAFIIYIVLLVRDAKKNRVQEIQVEVNDEEVKKQKSVPVIIFFTILGAVLIVIGGQATVWSATNLAEAIGISPRVIGLTVVALGTSLPEFVTGVVAYRKGEGGIAVGNIIGSNIFNILLVLGLAGSILPLTVSKDMILDISALLVGSLAFFLFSVTGKKISRVEGAAMLTIYAVYLTVLFVMT